MTEAITQLTEPEFPSQLLEIPQPPKRLWIKGVLPSQETTYLTVVGARKHTTYGKEACEKIIGGLRGYDITIVSGLAIGIDTIALMSALESGLTCIAVPGSGLGDSVLYPRSNVQLAARIVESGGALLSEFAPDFKATEWSFPQRNRIMAGLSKATLIIEAEKKSGTLITARLAADYNRDVFAVPGNIFFLASEGPNMLISLGATPITSSEDLLSALGFSLEKSNERKINMEGLSDQEVAVLEFLYEPHNRDDIIAMLMMSPSEVNILLMKMEIAGMIIDTPNGYRRA